MIKDAGRQWVLSPSHPLTRLRHRIRIKAWREMAAPAFFTCLGLLHTCASHACSRRYVLPRGVLCAGGSPWRRPSRSRALWCESAWPGKAAHPASSYTLSQRRAARVSDVDFNINIFVRHHRVVSGYYRYRNRILDSDNAAICLVSSSEAFPARLATYEPTHPMATAVSSA